MNNYSVPQPERYINPNKVNTTKFIKIFSSDPRNNPDFLRKNPFAVVINDNFSSEYANEYEDIVEPVVPIDPEPPLPPNNSNVLPPPINLMVKNFSLTKSGDGNAKYAATLTFDDVDDASDYDVLLVEVKDA